MINIISIVVGTRPEIIKMCPLIRECERLNLNYFILHTGQHYSYNLDTLFFEELNLPLPKYNINCKNSIGKIISKTNDILIKEKPNIVLVEGDTFSVLSTALSAFKSNIKIGHVEAGLRSYDINMPEEVNRIVVDHISDYLFAPTEKSKNNMVKEYINENKIFVVGNTIVDAVYQNLKFSSPHILNKLSLSSNKYILATLHRKENVDNKKRLDSILKGISSIYGYCNFPIILPVHPRTKKMIKQFMLKVPKQITLIDPVGFLNFLQLEKNAFTILTDSGGVQEEACILKVPCITLRDNTERPETIKVGSNILVDADKQKILDGFKTMSKKERNWNNPFGDGNTGKKIIDLIS